MKKSIPAMIAAFIITVVLGTGMLLIGSSALFTTSAAAASSATVQTTGQAEQVISQYMVREGQYTDQINKAQAIIDQKQAELDKANAELDQYRKLVTVLQQVGLITINSNGTIQINAKR